MMFLKANKNFLVRLLCLLMVLVALMGYQSKARSWAEEVVQNEQAIAEVESYNAEVLAAAGVSEKPNYKDGAYEGTATGYGGEIRVEVTVEDGRISTAEILSADGEDQAYLLIAESLLDVIVKQQDTEVDTITGATMSSEGIRDAVKKALKQAVPND